MNKPTDSVRIAVFDRDNPKQFLVLAEADDPMNWKLPGGKFTSTSETPDAAAARELYEELTADVTAVGLRYVGELMNDDGVSRRYIYTAMAAISDVQPSVEIAGVQWVQEATIPDSPNKAHMLSAIQLARTI